MKKCTKCGELKTLEEFYKKSSSKDGKATQCKQCCRSYDLRNKERITSNRRKNREENYDKIRCQQYRYNYGITKEDYDHLMESQEGVCKICKKKEDAICGRSKKVKNLCIDHCHTTKIIRGLLCDNCNRALGLLKDDIQVLENAKQYLRDAYGE